MPRFSPRLIQTYTPPIQQPRVCTEEERKIWNKYTFTPIENYNLEDVDLIKYQTSKTWEESLHALIDHDWDMVRATLFLLRNE